MIGVPVGRGRLGRAVRNRWHRSYPGWAARWLLRGRAEQVLHACDGLLVGAANMESRLDEVAFMLVRRGWRARHVEALRAGYGGDEESPVLKAGVQFVLVACALGGVPGDSADEQVAWAHALTSPRDALRDAMGLLTGTGRSSISEAVRKCEPWVDAAPAGLAAAAYAAGLSVAETRALTRADADRVQVMAALRRGF